ncbi:MAG: AAA family ATPase [Candidatus Gastranaerophilales bacterium]|nr:AAA family ATPase [Candidatus Gastranaerophilales bacterium]MCM1073078.1 AAA family ATPase [Bacteroides sp.]
MSIIVLDSNANSREILKSFLEELGLKDDLKLFADYFSGIAEIKSQEAPPIVFVDISNETPDLIETVKNIRLLTDKIVITSTDYSTDTIVKAMRLGAREFLPKPVIKNDLIRVVEMLSKPETELEITASKIITVYSNKGGIGKTTIASNLAAEIAKTTHDKVALVDLNLQLGDISTFLNLSPGFDVAYVIKNLIDKKEDTLLSAFEKYKDSKLYVLSDPNYIEQSESITPQQIESLFKTLKKSFPYIVVDMSSNIDPNSLKILDCSDLILFTTIVNIPAIRNAQRCLNLFKSRRYPSDKVKIIINRFMENDSITVEDIETTLGEKVYWKIPNNYFSIMESINKGLTVSEVNTNSNIANSFRNLASRISDDIVESSIIKYRI